jgi:hypothetical protein
LEDLERRVVVQIMHIQQAKLEADGGSYQHGEQLEEVGMDPARELTGANMLEEITEQNPNDEESMEVETAVEWQAKETKDEGNGMGDPCDLPMDKEEM